MRFMDPLEREEYMEDVHLRILRVTEDLRAIQRELNCAAMEAPNDPELMEALSELPELEALEVLKSSLDQMRHFLWFYVQVMTNDSEVGEKLAKRSPNGQSRKLLNETGTSMISRRSDDATVPGRRQEPEAELDRSVTAQRYTVHYSPQSIPA